MCLSHQIIDFSVYTSSEKVRFEQCESQDKYMQLFACIIGIRYLRQPLWKHFASNQEVLKWQLYVIWQGFNLS
jgi:hypothetical protein